jgi:hypothetical protein
MLVDASLQSVADQDHLYDAFMILGVMAEITCVSCLFLRRTYRRLPIFVIYMALTTATDAIGTWVYLTSSTNNYWHAFLLANITEDCLEVALIWEMITILWKEAAPIMSRRARIAITVGLMATCVSVALSSTSIVVYRHVSPGVSAYLQLDLGFGMFRTIMFMLILAFVRILGTRWHRLVAQLATYLGLFYVIDFACQIAHEAIAGTLTQYSHFDAIECCRIGAWTAVVLLIGWHVVSDERVGPRVIL